MKTLTKEDVKSIAVKLLQNDMVTTNLEIKKELRALGFFVTQHAVAKTMDELHMEGFFKFTYNGTYRLYFLSNLNEPLVTSTNTVKKISKLIKGNKTSIHIDTTNGICQYTNRNGKNIIGYVFLDKHKHKAFSTSNNVTDILYFDDGYTRDEMRYAFKKLSSEKNYKNIRVNLI